MKFSCLPSFSPLLEKLSSPGSSGDVITVQSTCKTHRPGEGFSLIDHPWLLFSPAHITEMASAQCSFAEMYTMKSQSGLIHRTHPHDGNPKMMWGILFLDLSCDIWGGLHYGWEFNVLYHNSDRRDILYDIHRHAEYFRFHFPSNEQGVDTISLMVLQSNTEVISLIILATPWLIGFILSFIILWAIWLQWKLIVLGSAEELYVELLNYRPCCQMCLILFIQLFYSNIS